MGSGQFGGDISEQNIKSWGFRCLISLQQYRQLPAPKRFCFVFTNMWKFSSKDGCAVCLSLGFSCFILERKFLKSVLTYKMPPLTHTTDFCDIEEPRLVNLLFQRGACSLCLGGDSVLDCALLFLGGTMTVTTPIKGSVPWGWLTASEV